MSSIPDVSKVNYNGVLYNVKDAVTRGKMDEVDAARQQAIQDIQAEGQTQTGAVTAEGTAQKNAVTEEGTRVLGTIPNDYTAMAGDVSDLKSAVSSMNTATASDKGKALKAKTVKDGTVTEWEFGEAVTVDNTLTQAGEAADAKAAGDGISALNDDVNGIESTGALTTVDGLNFAEYAVKYTAGGSYATQYIAVEEGNDYVISITNTTNPNKFEPRYSFATVIPAANVAGQYITKQSVPSMGTMTYTYGATGDGYLCVSYWKNVYTTFSAKIIAGGVKRDLVRIASEIDDIKAAQSTTAVNVDVLMDASGIYPFSTDDFELGSVSYSGSNFTYSASDKRVRLKQGKIFNFSAFTKIGLSSYSGVNMRVLYKIDDTIYTTDWIDHDFITGTNMDAAIMIAYDPESTIEDIDDLVSLLVIEPRSDFAKSVGTARTVAEKGSYWHGTPTIGTTTINNLHLSSSNYHSVFNLNAGEKLWVHGVGLSNLTRLFFVFDATTSILIDMPSTNEQSEIADHFLTYDVDTIVYVNYNVASECFAQLVDKFSYGSYVADLEGIRHNSIYGFNGGKQLDYYVQSLRRAANGKAAPVTLLHFSDLHTCTDNLRRIVNFMTHSHISPYITDVLCTGDVVNNLSDGMNWYNSISGSENILLAVGNHDVITNNGGTLATAEETYMALFSGKVDNWDVTQPEGAAANYLAYYYKDYDAQKLRLIVLDTTRSGDYRTAEIEWFENVLDDAKTNGLSVVCADHYVIPNGSSTVVECSFSDLIPYQDGFVLPDAFITSVENFIIGGGEFVCWLAGHVHQDIVKLHTSGHQLAIGVTTASYESERTKFGDAIRQYGTKSQDAFNLVGIDTYSKTISILRIGNDLTRLMITRNHMCIDYSTRRVIFSN